MKHIYCRLAHSIFFQDEWLRLRFLQGDNVSSEMDSLVIGTFNNVNYRVSVRYAGVLPLKLIPIFDWRVDVRINEQTLRRRMFKTTSHSVVSTVGRTLCTQLRNQRTWNSDNCNQIIGGSIFNLVSVDVSSKICYHNSKVGNVHSKPCDIMLMAIKVHD